MRPRKIKLTKKQAYKLAENVCFLTGEYPYFKENPKEYLEKYLEPQNLKTLEGWNQEFGYKYFIRKGARACAFDKKGNPLWDMLQLYRWSLKRRS